jgi:cardiolipin synthase
VTRPALRPADSLRSLVRRPRILRALRRLDRLTTFGEQQVVHGNAVAVLPGGREAFDAIEEAGASARTGVAIEMYTWSDDPVGRRMAGALRERLRAGVPVRVLVDAFGSLGHAAVLDGLRRQGAEILRYNPLAPRFSRWVPNRRNHRKAVLVDGGTAFLGGINFASCYSAEFCGDEAWADLMVRIDGPVVREIARLFLGTWARAGGDLESVADVVSQPRPAGPSPVQVLGRVGLRGSRALRRSFLANLELAQESVLLAYGYFVPDVGVRRGIARAVRRGAEVHVLVPGPTDVKMARWAGRAYYERLLGAGARLRELQHAVLHAKAAVFDREVAAVGSANLDPRSFHVNVELVANVFDPAVAREVERVLRAHWDRSKEIRLSDWVRRPVRERLLEASAVLLRSWL